MSSHPDPVSDSRGMIDGMNPVVDETEYLFCTTTDADMAEAARPDALCWFVEAEGVSLILPASRALELGHPQRLPMRRIVLTVHSALDGVGLTAAVAGALVAAGIACNMVAAFHHDHVFVPAADADRAHAILRELQASA